MERARLKIFLIMMSIINTSLLLLGATPFLFISSIKKEYLKMMYFQIYIAMSGFLIIVILMSLYFSWDFFKKKKDRWAFISALIGIVYTIIHLLILKFVL